MDHIKAIGGNLMAWISVLAAFSERVMPILQFVAVLTAIAASVYTAIYFRKKAKKL